MSNWEDDDIEPSDSSCPKCGHGMVTCVCRSCGGAGCTAAGELHEMDPLWYDEDDVEDCSDCRGHGHFEWCQKCGWDATTKAFLNGAPAVPLPETLTAQPSTETK